MSYDGPRCCVDDCNTPVDEDPRERCDDCADTPHQFDPRGDGGPLAHWCTCGRTQHAPHHDPDYDGAAA